MTEPFDRRAERSVDLVRQSLPPTPEPLTVRDVDILRFLEATGARPRLDPAGVLLAPALFLPAFPPWSAIGRDGRRRPAAASADDGALPYRLMAGCDVVFTAPIRSGDSITATSRLESVVTKAGRSGPMLLVTTSTTYSGRDGDPKRVERWTLIHRD